MGSIVHKLNHALFSNRESSSIWFLIQVLTDFIFMIQIISFVFDYRIAEFWNDSSIYLFIKDIRKQSSIAVLLNNDFDSFLMVFYGCVGILGLLILLQCFTLISGSKTPIICKGPLRLLAILLTSVLILPMTNMFLSFSCISTKQVRPIDKLFPNVQCWNSPIPVNVTESHEEMSSRLLISNGDSSHQVAADTTQPAEQNAGSNDCDSSESKGDSNVNGTTNSVQGNNNTNNSDNGDIANATSSNTSKGQSKDGNNSRTSDKNSNSNNANNIDTNTDKNGSITTQDHSSSSTTNTTNDTSSSNTTSASTNNDTSLNPSNSTSDKNNSSSTNSAPPSTPSSHSTSSNSTLNNTTTTTNTRTSTEQQEVFDAYILNIIAIVCIIVYFIEIFYFLQYNYQFRSNTNDSTAKAESNTTMTSILMMICLISSYNIVSDEEYAVLILFFIILIISILSFRTFNYFSPFFSTFLYRIWAIFSASVMTLSIILVTSLFYKDSQLTDQLIIAWYCSIVFYGFLICSSYDYRKQDYLYHLNVYEPNEDHTLHRLFPSKEEYLANTPDIYREILDQMIEIETREIPKADFDQVKFDGQHFDDNEVAFILTVDHLFIDLMKKFPQDDELKVDFAQFYFEKMGNKDECYNMLNQCHIQSLDSAREMLASIYQGTIGAEISLQGGFAGSVQIELQ